MLYGESYYKQRARNFTPLLRQKKKTKTDSEVYRHGEEKRKKTQHKNFALTLLEKLYRVLTC